MLTISRTATPIRPTARAAPARAKRTRTVTHASLRDAADWLAAGFMKIFTPPTDGGVNWTGTSSGYPGNINRRQGKRSPDPVSPQQQEKKSEQGEVLAMEAKEEQPESNVPEFAEYLSGAVQRVMGHNFVGDETEPEWNGTPSGWSGDVRGRNDRDRDGFHSKKL